MINFDATNKIERAPDLRIFQFCVRAECRLSRSFAPRPYSLAVRFEAFCCNKLGFFGLVCLLLFKTDNDRGDLVSLQISE